MNVNEPIPSPVADGELEFKDGYNDNGRMCSTINFDKYGIGNELNIFLGAASFPGAQSGCGNFSVPFAIIVDPYQDYLAHPPGSIINAQGQVANPYGGQPWIMYPLLAHEIGHTLGRFVHTFDYPANHGDGFTDTPYPDGPSCNNPNPCSNNIMAYNVQGRDYLSPMQIGYMHFQIATGYRIILLAACNYNDSSSIAITSSQTWPIFQVIGGNLTIKNSSTLTVQCNVSIPQGGTVFVEPNCSLIVDGGNITNNCTSGVSPNFHLDPYSRMIVQDSSVLTLERGAKMEVHEHSRLIIKSGSKLIVKDGAELMVHFDGLIIIENGAELVINNKTPGKGLNIGGNSFPSRSAELRIEGKLTTADSVHLTNNGDGIISVVKTGVLNLGNNSDIRFTTGKGGTTLKLDSVVITTGGHQIDIVGGKIECTNWSKLILSPGDTLHMFVADLVLGQNSSLTISKNARVEMGEYSSAIAQNSGKLILEDSATLSVNRNSLVHIQDGGELILNNKTPNKGLCIGCGVPSPLNLPFLNNGELRIEGTLTTSDSIHLTNNGDGFIAFHNWGALNLGAGSNVVMRGKSNTDNLLKIYNALTIPAGHDLDVSKGTIVVNGDNAVLRKIGAKVFADSVIFDGLGGTTNTGLEISQLAFVPQIQNCTFTRHGIGLYAHNMPYATLVQKSTFSGNGIGVLAQNLNMPVIKGALRMSLLHRRIEGTLTPTPREVWGLTTAVCISQKFCNFTA